MAFSRVEEELSDDANRQTFITWETVLKFRDNLFGVALRSVCALRCTIESRTVHTSWFPRLCHSPC